MDFNKYKPIETNQNENNNQTNIEEYQYLNLLYGVAMFGTLKPNRTANKTKSIFGNIMKFTLTKNNKKILPLLTTKNMLKSSESIFKELIFFIKGQTDSKILSTAGVKIWDANTSREFLDSVGLDYEVGDIGQLYGINWRHYGIEYKGCKEDYTNQGFDQLQFVIDEIKKNPYSRRLLVTAWNPLILHKGVLAPCHTYFQFNVEPDENTNTPKYLSCMLYQRSADLPLGVPFNIASYATLTHMIANLTDLVAKELVYTTADTHVYEDQLYLIPGQIFRKPYDFPNIEFDFSNDVIKSIDDYKVEHIKLTNYKFHPLISYPFSV